MLGKLFKLNKILSKSYCYEHTRFRKKPPHGKNERILKNQNKIFDFNAWLVIIHSINLYFNHFFLIAGTMLNGTKNRNKKHEIPF